VRIQSSSLVVASPTAPPYGQRRGWVPRSLEVRCIQEVVEKCIGGQRVHVTAVLTRVTKLLRLENLHEDQCSDSVSMLLKWNLIKSF
jgi:DNA replicative helicase MCM subunit Mcm2 (Cdc46/Mcm family)